MKIKLLILAVVLRLLVSAFIFHPDIKTFNFQSQFLRRGVFNIYTYLETNKSNLSMKDEFVYFPLTYFTLGGYQAISSPFLGKAFGTWLNNADSNTFTLDPNIFKYLVILKLPYLIFDFAIAFLLLKYFDDKKLDKKAFTLWLFNPFTIYYIYAFGNVDIFPVAITLLSLILVKSNKLKLAALSLGIAAGFKLYPLLFVPFLILKGKNIKEKFLLGFIPFLTFGLISLPFMSQAFIKSTLISGLTTRIFNPGFEVGFGESIIVGLLLFAALFYIAWLMDKKISVFKYWLTTLLIIFSFSHFHVAWLLWIAPFVVILSIKKTYLSYPLFYLAVIATIIPLLYQDRSMSISLYRIYSSWFDLIPTPFTLIQKIFDPYNLQSILHSLFAGGAGVIIYKIFKSEKLTR
ncbi:MAG TPA: hypothetical protein VI795_02685 [Patescibacteria group bacterium]|nr:hypothetical protein [Patescibacteria group bacterium]